MTDEVNVVSRSQRIIVQPYSRSVSVINAGPVGAGLPGEKGDPGDPGGSILSAFWQYSSTTSAPPGSGQVRSNVGLTLLWVHTIDTDGMNRTVGLASITEGNTIYVRAANGSAVDLDITGTPTLIGSYYEFPVSVITGTITKGSRTQINFITAPGVGPPGVGIPSGGTVGQMVVKASATDYDTEFQDQLVTNRITVSTTEPVSPAVDDIWVVKP